MTDAKEIHGSKFDTDEIVCPYCLSKGSFDIIFEAERESSVRMHNSAIWLVIKCKICVNNTFAIISKAGNFSQLAGFKGNGQRNYREYKKYYRSLWPQRADNIRISDSWPERPAKLFRQAQEAINSHSWDAALGMSRASMQSIMKDLEAPDTTINRQIDELISSGKLPPVMGEWAHEIRKNGNIVLHGDLDFEADEETAREIVNFNFYLFEYLYTLPAKIQKLRATPNAPDAPSNQGTIVSPQSGSGS